MNEWAIEASALDKHFGTKAALAGVELRLRCGEMVALLGASGAGKSTLMRMLNGLHLADAGSASTVRIHGRVLQQGGRLATDARSLRSQVATIFQQFNLVGRLPVMTNVLAGALHRLPLWRTVLRRFPEHELIRAHEALQRVGMETLAWQRASTLSGGQQQRAAISRAMVQGASIVLADEPVASLDPASSRRVMELLQAVNRDLGVTLLVSLHQLSHAFDFCPRTVALNAGRVVFDGPTAELTQHKLQQLYGESLPSGLQPPDRNRLEHPCNDVLSSLRC